MVIFFLRDAYNQGFKKVKCGFKNLCPSVLHLLNKIREGVIFFVRAMYNQGWGKVTWGCDVSAQSAKTEPAQGQRRAVFGRPMLFVAILRPIYLPLGAGAGLM